MGNATIQIEENLQGQNHRHVDYHEIRMKQISLKSTNVSPKMGPRYQMHKLR